jgi:asparagine synthase (glutamine-hydrolysing)
VDSSGRVFLGHRRLTIIDLSAGSNQPISRDDLVLVFNGEIYNYKLLREELKGRGVSFSTTGDVEVLLRVLQCWGAAGLRRLEGMFSFALWSTVSRKLLVARDSFGIKPLYFARLPDGSVAFASEAKAFLAFQEFPNEVNQSNLQEYLRFRSVAGDGTLIQSMFQIRPGEYAEVNGETGQMTRRFYWDPTQSISSGEKPTHVDDFLEKFEPILSRHLISDVPLGTQFSGGVDSSLVAAVATRTLNSGMAGFYCRVMDSEFDETPYARHIAQRLRIDLHESILDAKTFFLDLFEHLTWHFDEPISHPNSVGVYLLSRAAKGKVKVLLSGEAADELFCGYTWYRLMRARGIIVTVPPALRGVTSAPRKLRRLASESKRLRSMSLDGIITSNTQFMSPELVSLLVNEPPDPNTGLSTRSAILSRIPHGLDPVLRNQVYDVMTYLPPLFVRQDKMSMAASIENRVPLAVPELYAYATSLRAFDRSGLLGQKYALKRALERFIPRRLVYRKKWGFAVPLALWFDGQYGIDALQTLRDSNAPAYDYLDRKTVMELVNSFAQEKEKAEALWIILAFNMWRATWKRARIGQS